MTQATPLTRLKALPRERRRVLLRALFALTAASTAVAFLPFRTAIKFGSIALKRSIDVRPKDCVWAVEVAARRVPWRAMCIQKGLAVQRLLRSSGVDAVLHYGARRTADSGELQAHVWVSVADEVIVGGEDAPDFAEIAIFPLPGPSVAEKRIKTSGGRAEHSGAHSPSTTSRPIS